MEATPQPLEGLRGPVGSRVFFIIQDEETRKIMVSWSKKREKSDHPGARNGSTTQGGRKARHTKAAEGGLSWIVISNSFLLVQI